MDPNISARLKHHFKLVAPPHPTAAVAAVQPLPVTGFTARHPDKWAYVSIVERLPQILRQLQKTGGLTSAQADAICDAIAVNALLPKISTGPDVDKWNEASDDLTWLEASWLFVEALLYRHIADLTGFFQSKIDPFKPQKMDALKSALGSMEALEVEFASTLLKAPSGTLSRAHFEIALQSNLWSNKSDLSKNPEGSSVGKLLHDLEKLHPYILLNDSDAIFDLISSLLPSSPSLKPQGELHFIVDNAGLEIVTDIYLAELLLHHGCFSKVVLHVKLHPTFVSDVIDVDIDDTLAFFDQHPELAPAAARWRSLLASGRLIVASHKFWNSFLPFWMLESTEVELTDSLRRASLVLIKGDANARRLHGDLRWDFSTPTRTIVDYLPFNCGMIRTLKSETVSGVGKEVIDSMKCSNWYYDGIYGTIQFVTGKMAF